MGLIRPKKNVQKVADKPSQMPTLPLNVRKLNISSPESPTTGRGRGEIPAENKSNFSLDEFADFWGDQENTQPQEANANGVEIGTPRKGQAPPLQVFKVATPPSSPRKRPVTKQSYVPPWPYGSHWPFNCAPTTLELRGLPRGYTAEMLVAQLDAFGFAGRYDLVYVPRNRSCADLAIVNAVRHADGCAIAGRLHGFSDWMYINKQQRLKKKSCRVAWSFTCQGMDAVVQDFHHSSQSWGIAEDGTYVGPWVLNQGAWTQLFHPAHMWPVVYADAWHVNDNT